MPYDTLSARAATSSSSPVPFTDLSSSKRRPALAVSADTFNERMQDLLLAAITSTIYSILILKKICTLRPAKRRAEVRDHALAVDRHGPACPLRDQSGPIPLQQR
jgi:mRNA-degrading endonuclease toxin of MazEF toxin-antitoxin module